MPYAPNIPALDRALTRFTFFGGCYGAGKDWVAKKLAPNALVVKVAEPLYRLVERLTGRRPDKSQPGDRETLQRLGAWGRGDVNAAQPWTAERAAGTAFIREHVGVAGYDFSEFGARADFWADTFAQTLRNTPAGVDVVCTDVRFMQEIGRALNYGPFFMVVCSPKTLARRREQCGYPPGAARDPSEAIANGVMERLDDAGALCEWLDKHRVSGVLWNDTELVPESLVRFGRTVRLPE